MSALYIPFKIDLFHRDTSITFGPRFKGERGKDILAAKIALGILRPIAESENFESSVSFDPDVPLDNQGWFDCATGLGTDLMRATLFDSSLENALLTYQINNTFLITSYIFYKVGIVEIMRSFDNPDSSFLTRRSLLIAGIDATLALFESELGTLGEATIAVMHGWTPSSRPENESYRHNSFTYNETDTVVSIIPNFLYESLNDLTYPQNIQDLIRQGWVVPGSLKRGVDFTPEESEDLALRVPPSQNWNTTQGASPGDSADQTDDNFAKLEYYTNLSGISVLYKAATSVIDYYIENDLFSKTLTTEELAEAARSAIYPDPFSSEDPFIISNTKIGIYLSTDFELDPNKLPVKDEQTIMDLEETALLRVLRYFKKPEIWNFLRQDQEFIGAYYSSVFGDEPLPNHTGIFPRKITQRMVEKMENFTNSVPSFDSEEFTEYKKQNYWSISTKDIIESIEGDNLLRDSVQLWREIEGLGQTRPLIKFIRYITPTLRPGQKYRAYLEINKSKLDLIKDGDSLQELPRVESVPEVSDPSACLDENSEQAQKSYEEYKAHAMRRRRELVREIRERAQERDLSRPTTVDLGSFGYLPGIQSFNFNGLSDYELTQKVIQSAFPAELLETAAVEELNRLNELTTMSPGSSGTDSNNTDEDENSLTITFQDLKQRVESAAFDLRESAKVIKRESIRFVPGSGFNAENEALRLEEFVTSLGDDALLFDDDTDIVSIHFNKVETSSPGPQNGKIISKITVDGTTYQEFQTEANKRPRTVNYISNIKKMTSFPKLTTFFRDARNSCQDLGIDVDKMTTYKFVSKYTSGLKIIVDKTDTSVFQSWVDSTEDKIKSTWTTTKSNMEASFDKSNFNSDAALRALGQKCTERDIYELVYNKLSLPALLCDYIKCVRLPPFDIKLPRFNFDPIPEIKVFGWLSGLDDFIEKQMDEIKTRLACTLAKLIIDKLAFPFCEEQLAEFINTSPQTLPEARQALIDSLVSTGIVPGKEDDAKNFFDATAGMLTGRELCYLLEGNRPDNATMSAVQRLASTFGVQSDLDTDEKLVNFFGVLGSYLPDNFCEDIGRSTTVAPTSCEDINSYTRAVRNRLMSGDSSLSEEEIEEVVDQIEREKEAEAEKLKKLLENGFSGMTAPTFELGNPESPLSDFPNHIKNQLKKSGTNFFSSAKTSYTEDLAEYVPSLATSSPANIQVYDPRYNESEILATETALEQLQNFSSKMTFYTEEQPRENIDDVYPTVARYADLHQLFDTEIIEEIDARYVPRLNREGLEAIFVDGNIESYKIPHETIKVSYLYRNESKDFRVTEEIVQGARVHKRRIKIDGQINFDVQIDSLNAIINSLTRRVRRTSFGKKKRLKKQRNVYIQQRNELIKLRQDQTAEREPVSLEFYLDYQQRAREQGIPIEQRLEFELVPFTKPTTLGSTSKQYSNFSSEDVSVFTAVGGGDHLLTSNGSGVAWIQRIATLAVDDAGITTDISDLIKAKRANELVQDRINSLTDRISQILQRAPNIVEDYILLGVQNMLDSETERNLESMRSGENVEQGENSYKLEFNPGGSVYSPSITMKEYPAKHDKDRYDIIFSGDYYLGQLSKEEKITKKYCEQLLPNWEDPELTQLEGTDEASLVFGKRIKFKNIIKQNVKNYFDNAFSNTEYINFLKEDLFKKTTEGILESLLDELSDSDLFDGDYISLLDNRVAGKRTINRTCVSNRFSLGLGSIISFDDVIMDDVSSEIGKEMAKPENSLANSDFDSHSGLDKAFQNLSLKAFIRVCLIDTFLKGGLAYAVWDFEPIAGEKITIDYIIEHVRQQLNNSSDLKEMWGRILERVTGISNKDTALEYFIKQEIVKLPNYSKQIFNPQESETDFYNWYFSQNFIPHFPVYGFLSESIPEDEELKTQGYRKIGWLQTPANGRSRPKHFVFNTDKPSFFTEEYIRISITSVGSSNFENYLKEWYRGLDTPNNSLPSIREGYLLSPNEFGALLKSIHDPDPTQSAAANVETKEQFLEFLTDVRIFHEVRLCILDNLVDEDSDSKIPKQLNFIKQSYSQEDIAAESFANRAFNVIAHIETLDEEADQIVIKEIPAFSIPLTSFKREMDFEDCYNILLDISTRSQFSDLGVASDYDPVDDRLERELDAARAFMINKLYESKESKMLFESIFPIRRFMSMVSVYATSVVSGYSSMPDLLTSTKLALTENIKVSNLTRNQKAEIPFFAQSEFAKQLLENFPTSEDSCLEFPDLFTDFWKKMIRDMIKLLKKMPSIILRGIANQLDPGYQEMRQHYMNCDIKNLTFRGVKPAGTIDFKLTNGLYLEGRSRDPTANVSNLQGKGKGKYVPLFLGFGSDLGYAAQSLPNTNLFGARLAIALLKLTTYIYSGNAPFLDPATHFKIPCADQNIGLWRDKGKYDAGVFGRYGHPLTPFTYMALTTPQLESDKRQRENICFEEEIPKDDCEDLPQDQIITYADPAPPTDEEVARATAAAEQRQEDIDFQRQLEEENQEYIDSLNGMTPEERQAELETFLEETETDSSIFTEQQDDCEEIRISIRETLSRAASTTGPNAPQRRADALSVAGQLKRRLMTQGPCAGAPTGQYWSPSAGDLGNGGYVEYTTADVMDSVQVILISQTTGEEVKRRGGILIPFEYRRYLPFEQQGVYYVYTEEEYENFGK